MNKMALFAIIGTAMFLLSGGTAFATTPSGPAHIQPNPMMNTNITWSSFNSSWAPLEYYNGTANATLPAELNPNVAEPITVNASAIRTTAYNKEIGTTWWNNSANWWTAGNSGGAILSVSTTTVNGKPAIKIEMNATSQSSNGIGIALPITWNELPSQNLAYDYATIEGFAYGTTTLLSDRIAVFNQTSIGTDPFSNIIDIANESAYAGQTPYSITNAQSFFASASLNEPNISMEKSTGISIGFNAVTPKETSAPINIIITGISITEYQLSLGQTNMGGNHQATAYTGSAELSALDPSFAWSSITNNGYSVAVSQPLQNLTTQQNAISSGNYIEQVEYQGQFNLPTAPDLSYGSANLTEQFNVSTSQTQVLDINGESYLSTISGKNGTIQLLSTVNQNSKIQFLQIVDYTQSQWNSISNSPGLFTLAGIEYYWWIAVGGLATLIGLGAAAKHAGTKADQERIRRGR